MKKTIEYDITLSDQVAKSSCVEVARLLGLTKDAVRQMVANRREIYLRFVSPDSAEYCEYKGWLDGSSVKAGPATAERLKRKRARIAAKKKSAAA